MTSMIFRMIATVVALPLCVYLLPGVSAPDYMSAMIAGAALAVIYAILRPVFKLVLGVFNIFTLGLLYIALDAWLVQLCAYVMPENIQVESFLWALAAAAIVNVLRSVIGSMFKKKK